VIDLHRRALQRRLGALACGLVLVWGFIPAAFAQAYPSKAVRMVLPSAAGGGTDILGRILAGKLSEMWGQPVVADNKPGANFIIGTDAVAKAAPDGYTLLFVPSPALTTNPVVLPQLPYDPLRDLSPVIMVTFSPFLLLVNNSLPVNSVQELLAHLRANPGKLNHASNSASTRLVSELFKSLAKVEYAEINYKGGALSAASVSSGETQLSFVDVGSATPLVRSGRVRALAVTTAQRYKLRPDIPTLNEAGVPGYATAGLTVVMVPAKTPREIVSKLNADLARVIAMPDVVERIEAVGNVVLGGSAEEAVQTLKKDAETWARLVNERNISFQ
jgi:tripartite-type tricarboxylate transporter receptor subunit TctC